MEQLRVDGARGQNYGYTLYRAHVPGPASQLAFTDLPQDRAQVIYKNYVYARMLYIH